MEEVEDLGSGVDVAAAQHRIGRSIHHCNGRGPGAWQVPQTSRGTLTALKVSQCFQPWTDQVQNASMTVIRGTAWRRMKMKISHPRPPARSAI
ncbi:hypothetical protein [Actinacidiphila glaucinigra]|uniref:hypothetical protein n=1 Tax=Actinacidiphila glaucinigra TaxID=235986 RepID=UPI0015C5E893|nr:hypothetical protein [Actinacidiphila glaucinigra]